MSRHPTPSSAAGAEQRFDTEPIYQRAGTPPPIGSQDRRGPSEPPPRPHRRSRIVFLRMNSSLPTPRRGPASPHRPRPRPSGRRIGVVRVSPSPRPRRRSRIVFLRMNSSLPTPRPGPASPHRPRPRPSGRRIGVVRVNPSPRTHRRSRIVFLRMNSSLPTPRRGTATVTHRTRGPFQPGPARRGSSRLHTHPGQVARG